MGNISKFIDSKNSEFIFKPCVIAGDDCWLITPSTMGTHWDDSNARFRSCIVRQSDNYVVSQGFGKFVNFSEKPDFQPWDNEWKFEARHKLDGSLLIVSVYKNEWILRTRGTKDARSMANGHEIDLLMSKYSTFFEDNKDFTQAVGISWLFEWVTPTNIIVLRESNEPKLILVGAVLNEDCTYYSQQYLDIVGEEFGFERPARYEYDSIHDCILDVDAWSGKEGVVLYSPDGQTLKKIKASEYCELHKICTGVRTIENVVDMFLETDRFTTSHDFYTYVETTIDFELAEKIKDDIVIVIDAYNKTLFKIDAVGKFINTISGDSYTRKDQALEIVERYTDWRRSLAFLLLDNKDAPDKLIKQGMMEVIDEV